MADTDFLHICRPGTILQTRDRREVRITEIDSQRGIISGSVQMMGPCRWRADGRFADAPAGAAGPLDLVPPAAETRWQESGDGNRASLKEALQDPTTRGSCCD
ncbi:MAG: hypothetical protein ABWY00_14625 [Dongiaceae bacterium]